MRVESVSQKPITSAGARQWWAAFSTEMGVSRTLRGYSWVVSWASCDQASAMVTPSPKTLRMVTSCTVMSDPP